MVYQFSASMKFKTKVYDNKEDLFNLWSSLKCDHIFSIAPTMNCFYEESEITGCYLEFEVKNKNHREDLDKIKESIDFLE